MTTRVATPASPFLGGDDSRRENAAIAAGLNGIDAVEVATPDQRTLRVHFLLPLPGEPGGPATPALTPGALRVEGGVRVPGVRVTSVSSAGTRLTVVVDRAGDFSPYTIGVVAGPGLDEPPAGFDPALASCRFSFKARCESAFDRASPAPAGVPGPASPVVDYLARDYTTFTRLLLDRLSLISPAWADRSPADPHIALIEVLADLGDRLAYEQDAAATEAYPGTARSRISLRRHTRLLDYTVDDGANATTWVLLDVTPGGSLDGTSLDAGRLLLTGAGGARAGVPPETLDAELREGAIVFRTTAPIPLSSPRNRIRLHLWSGCDRTLARGATAVDLVRPPGLTFAPGDLLLLEQERSPLTGAVADADPALRHLVRLTGVVTRTDPVTATPLLTVSWSVAQALPFDLTLSARAGTGGEVIDTAVARGNLGPADHGRPVVLPGALVVPEATDRPFRPRLDLADLTVVGQPDEGGLPAISLDDGSGTFDWQPVVDLLSSAADDPSFVVEFEHGHRPVLRFGDGVHGRRPAPGTVFTVAARRGTGPSGNVGADAVSRLVTSDPGAVRAVRNPFPATGGRPPESRDHILVHAPVAFRTQRRAVTAADWVEIAQRHPGVQRASARLRWTGSWWTVFVAVDRISGGGVVADATLAGELRDYLDRFRMTGVDLELVDPVFVPLDLQVRITVAPDRFRGDVVRAVHEAISPGPHRSGATGLCHPDRLTFGQPLHLSAIHAAADGTPGVRYAEILACHPLGRAPAEELARGIVTVGPGEVLRLDDDPNRPEHGRLRVDAVGGV